MQIAYVIFIIALAYIILYPQDPQCPDWIEWYVIAYFTTQFLECIREFISIDAMSLSEKVAEIRLNVWRFGDLLVTSICLFCGVVLRLTGFFNYGMLIFRVSSIYWNLRLYKYLGAHRFVGPKIVMMRRMLTHMVKCINKNVLIILKKTDIIYYIRWTEFVDTLCNDYCRGHNFFWNCTGVN